MADRTIGELPVADHLDDDSLLVVEQQAQARSIKGALVRQFAEAATDAHVKAAQAAAEQAGESAQAAAGSAAAAGESAKDAAESAQHAEQYSGNLRRSRMAHGGSGTLTRKNMRTPGKLSAATSCTPHLRLSRKPEICI